MVYLSSNVHTQPFLFYSATRAGIIKIMSKLTPVSTHAPSSVLASSSVNDSLKTGVSFLISTISSLFSNTIELSGATSQLTSIKLNLAGLCSCQQSWTKPCFPGQRGAVTVFPNRLIHSCFTTLHRLCLGPPLLKTM